MEEAKTCAECGKTMRGRSDKKFCDDYCRNNYNNRLKSHTNNYVRNINNALSKNRRILENALPLNEDKGTTSKQKLVQAGFQFKYITHMHTYKNGNTYFFCYEYGYRPIDNEGYLIVRKREE